MTCSSSSVLLNLTLGSLALMLLNIISAQEFLKIINTTRAEATSVWDGPYFPYSVPTNITAIENESQQAIDWSINFAGLVGFSVGSGEMYPAISPSETMVIMPNQPLHHQRHQIIRVETLEYMFLESFDDSQLKSKPMLISTDDNNDILNSLAPLEKDLPAIANPQASHRTFISTEFGYTASFGISYTLSTVPTMTVTPFLELPTPTNPSSGSKTMAERDIIKKIAFKPRLGQPPSPVPESSPTINITPPTPALVL